MAPTTNKRRLGSAFCAAAAALLGLRGLTLLHTRDDGSLQEWHDSAEDDAAGRRLLGSMDDAYEGEEDYDASYSAAFDTDFVPREYEIQPYALEDAVSEAKVFQYAFAILIYDPPTDSFRAMYSKEHTWRPCNKKLNISVRHLVHALRTLFPERFRPNQPEFAVALGSGDYPHVDRLALPHSGVAPVLEFGSAFREKEVYTNMVAMPLPANEHLYCLTTFMDKGHVCSELRAKGSTRAGSMVFGDELGLKWEDLKPQLTWRGSDFGFLPSLSEKHAALKAPRALKFDSFATQGGEKRAGVVDELMEKFHKLAPRWKGVALSAQAELEAQGTDKLPWADIRLSSYMGSGSGKARTVGSPKYAPWESVDIATGTGLSHEELAVYRYHIDLGGGGGTTWSGTVEKLAMPGLLFHHVTPTKDYVHDFLVPWRHYVPVRSDLADLRAKFDWVESHPEAARRIADEGTAFMRGLATEEGYGALFREAYAEPLRRVIEAYWPLEAGTSWRDVMGGFVPVLECAGSEITSCQYLLSKDDMVKWAKEGHDEAPKSTAPKERGADRRARKLRDREPAAERHNEAPKSRALKERRTDRQARKLQGQDEAMKTRAIEEFRAVHQARNLEGSEPQPNPYYKPLVERRADRLARKLQDGKPAAQ